MWNNSSNGNGMMKMTTTMMRYFSSSSRKRAPNLRKINPRVPFEEAAYLAEGLYGIIKTNGPLTISNAWNHAKDLYFYSNTRLWSGSVIEGLLRVLFGDNEWLELEMILDEIQNQGIITLMNNAGCRYKRIKQQNTHEVAVEMDAGSEYAEANLVEHLYHSAHQKLVFSALRELGNVAAHLLARSAKGDVEGVVDLPADEDGIHVSVGCTFARQVWVLAWLPRKPIERMAASFETWIRGLHRDLEEEEHSLALVIIWFLWYNRNTKLMENSFMESASLVKAAKSFLSSLNQLLLVVMS
ncbi:hypothetical protein BUALT_Bualt05G0085600 [Buddleja alternifolia]|uniref:Uncharacterized protein n=1 Tax=Buddleja alternifolia TaxID=168488 RepID=A0AAV6XJ59_9LAMI|nr:hypothetical protein BUALT_Bualt05G0085600 [Buddleja alternifolia]